MRMGSMKENSCVFICFASEDRHTIAEPVAHHLKNYGIDIWYDRYSLLLGDNRFEKNLKEGAESCSYALIILSENTIKSKCAMEEIEIIKKEYILGKTTIFPILYEIAPDDLAFDLQWIKKVIFKEIVRNSGTREVCNHIACKITEDILYACEHQSLKDLLHLNRLPNVTTAILKTYLKVDASNLNSRISLLYAAYLTLTYSKISKESYYMHIISKIYNRIISEINLNLDIDYRELWLLENAMCILCNIYLSS